MVDFIPQSQMDQDEILAHIIAGLGNDDRFQGFGYLDPADVRGGDSVEYGRDAGDPVLNFTILNKLFLINTGEIVGGDVYHIGYRPFRPPGNDAFDFQWYFYDDTGTFVRFEEIYRYRDGAITGSQLLEFLFAGDDLIRFANTAPEVHVAVDGTRTLIGQTLNGYDGNDEIQGSAGPDILIGGLGNDTIFGTSDRTNDRYEAEFGVGDTIYGGPGNDVIVGHGGNDMIDGGSGFDIAWYNFAPSRVFVNLQLGANQASGGDGTDQLVSIENIGGSAYNDILRGDDGSNNFNGFHGNDLIALRGGVDYGYGGRGNDRIFGEDGNDFLYGQAHNDFLRGGNGRDRLFGEHGNDRIYGDAGMDFITGGLGRDILIGGADRDRFIYESVRDSRGSLRDKIFYYEQGLDDIDLRAIDAVARVAGNQRFKFIGDDPFTGAAGELHVFQVGRGARLEADVTGNGRADFTIDITGTTFLTAGDIFL